MARPSVTDQRIEEILSAYERCIAKFGVHGATLAQIAAEAKLSRPLVRHHAGNQSDLLKKAVERFLERTKNMLAYCPAGVCPNIESFLEVLFSNEDNNIDNDTLVAAAFSMAAANDDFVREKMQVWFEMISGWFVAHVSSLFPDRDKERVHAVAIGVMGISFNNDSLAPLHTTEKSMREHSKNAARILLRNLENERVVE